MNEPITNTNANLYGPVEFWTTEYSKTLRALVTKANCIISQTKGKTAALSLTEIDRHDGTNPGECVLNASSLDEIFFLLDMLLEKVK